MNAPAFTQLSTKVLRPRLPCVGNIKIGGKGEKRKNDQGGDWYLPVKYDHFRITKRARGKDENFLLDDEAHAALGNPKPTLLGVRLLFPEPANNWHTKLSCYDGTTPRCEGNGEQAFDYALDREIPCPCPLLKQFDGEYEGPERPVGKLVCKPYGVLSVILEAAPRLGGFHVFRTTSWETIRSITAALDFFQQNFGRVDWIPFDLELYPATDTYVDNGKHKRATSYKVALTLRGNMETAFQIAGATAARRAELLQLTGGTEYTPEEHARELDRIAAEDAREIGQEFHPPVATADGDPVLEAEIVDEDQEEADREEEHLERICRLALTFADWETLRINQQLAKYTGRAGELLKILEQKFPGAVEKAREEDARLRASADQPPNSAAAEEAPPPSSTTEPPPAKQATRMQPELELF